MNTSNIPDDFVECSREEATFVWFAGNAHLIAEKQQDVFWCDGVYCFRFYAPGKAGDAFYTAWYPNDAQPGHQPLVFLKEKCAQKAKVGTKKITRIPAPYNLDQEEVTGRIQLSMTERGLCRQTATMLKGAFMWGWSAERHDFWEAVCDRLVALSNGEPLG